MQTVTRNQIKALQALRRNPERQAQGRVLIEGARLVEEAVQSHAAVEQLLVTGAVAAKEWFKTLSQTAQLAAVPTMQITSTQSEQLSETRTPQGIFAGLKIPAMEPRIEHTHGTLLILDGISDPGNLGTILRSADWFGVDAVWVTGESADLWNGKVMRAGMGAHFHLPNLCQADERALAKILNQSDLMLVGASVSGSSPAQWQPVERWGLVVGSEAHGISPFWTHRLVATIAIPGTGRAESLNAAVAAGVLLYVLTGDGRGSPMEELEEQK